VRQKNYQKPYSINKALAIDNQNRLYWKRYATINKHMNFLKKLNLVLERRLNLGYRLDTWLFWVDILQFLGEFERYSNPIASNRILSKRTKSNTVWLESIL
jgi:hypothetical protein